MPARREHDRPILLAMLTALGVLVQSAIGLPQDPPEVDIPATEQRIRRLLENMDDDQLITEGRSQALDEAIELRAGMISAAPEDPRRGIWHADQAEDLLLKRIEFPNSWSTHLLNADPGCRIMPNEIPIIIARGIGEATDAGRAAARAIEILERQPPAGRNERLIGQLKFERDVRAPLLESIGLVLASRIEASAADKAFETLLRLSREQTEDEMIVRIVKHWLTLAAIEAGRAGELDVAPGKVESLDELDRIRNSIILESPADAARKARTAFTSTPPGDRHRRLLIADLHERALDGSPDDAGWSADRGLLWLRLLDDPIGRTDRSYDGVIAGRLGALIERLGRKKLPLGAAWALGEEELSARTAGSPSAPDAAALLDELLQDASVGTAGRARALGVRARLAISDADRLIAARMLEKLCTDHPDSTEADPCVLADLLLPAIGTAPEWISPSYERALRSCIDASTEETPKNARRRNLRRLELAEHMLNEDRGAEALDALDAIRTESAAIGAMSLTLQSRAVRALAESNALDGEAIKARQRVIADRHAALVSRFGTINPELRAAGANTRLDAVRTGLFTGMPTAEDFEAMQEIAADEALEDGIRISALLLRHELRVRLEDDEKTRRYGQDLIEGLRINATQARDQLINHARKQLELIEEKRERGVKVGPDDPIRLMLQPYALVLDSGLPPSANIIDRITLARVLLEGGRLQSSLVIWDGIRKEHPNTLEVMVGRADVLWALETMESMGEAIRIYQTLGRGSPGDLVPKEVWWLAQLRQLLILEKVGRSLDRISPRIERLRLIDPDLGGDRYRDEFESLRERLRQRDGE